MARNNNISEEKLKELQRKEALSDSDEYDIQDTTYERAPLTRQYVKDDVVVKGSEFVDGDVQNTKQKNITHEDRIFDDEEDDDIIVIEEVPVIDIPPVEDVNEIYTKKAPITEEPTVEIFEEQKSPKVTPKKQAKDVFRQEPAEPKKKTETSLTRKNFDTNDFNRDYIDRENTIYNNEETQKFEKVVHEKPKKEKKPVNLSWLKPTLAIVAILLSLILAILLFFFIKDFTSEKQELSLEKAEYIELVEMTNDTMLNENAVAKEFLSVTEQFVIDAITKDAYIDKLNRLYEELNTEMVTYSNSRFNHVKDYEIKSLVLDYLKITLKSMESILNIQEQSVIELKTLILSTVNDRMSTRQNQYSNLLALMNETSASYNIESELKENIIYFNISMD